MSSFNNPTQETALQRILPYVIAVLCVLLQGLPLGLATLPQLSLGLFLVPLFAVSLQSEQDITPVFFILIGLLADFLTEAPIGYWAFLCCLFYILSSGQKQVLQNAAFSSHWTSFLIVILIVYLAGFAISLMRDDLTIRFVGHTLSALATGLFYPVIAGPLRWLGRVGGTQERI